MNMQEIGYFLFMEEQEKQHTEFNAEIKPYFVGEMPSQNQKELKKNIFSCYTRPLRYSWLECIEEKNK
jgi:hypothetical protein